jgi:hypothetical protein
MMLLLLLPDFQGGEVGSGLGGRSSLLGDELRGSRLLGGLRGDLGLISLLLRQLLEQLPLHFDKLGFWLGYGGRHAALLMLLVLTNSRGRRGGPRAKIRA